MNKKPIIEFNHVTKSYNLFYDISYKEILLNAILRRQTEIKKRFTALEDISFSIDEGESVGIIGRNGSGKSTTLGLVAGVLKPDSGTVNVRAPVSPLLELGGGFHPDLNAYENIRLNGALLGIDSDTVENGIEEIIEFAELGDFAAQPIRTYSSGMLARLGFSIVTKLDPKLLLLDEVLAVGDDAFRKKCIDVMLGFKKKGITILFVSHNAAEIQLICDRVIWIDQHRIRMDGKTEEVLPEYDRFMQLQYKE
ncbi:ABC transporter ATP-binding protein [Nitratifractor sp.]